MLFNAVARVISRTNKRFVNLFCPTGMDKIHNHNQAPALLKIGKISLCVMFQMTLERES